MTVSRELSLVYGSITSGGASAGTYDPDGYPTFTMDRGLDGITGTVEWDVIVRGSSEANFKTNCNALEAEFLNPFQRFRWIYGSTTFIDWNPSDDSGFNAQPSCRVVPGPPNSARARKYRCSVAVQLPADNNSGRISSSITVAYDKSDRRTVTVNARYTAQSGTGALSNAQSKAPTFASSFLSGIGGTYEILGTGSFDVDDQDKICDVTLQYREIKYNQVSGTANNANIVDHVVSFRRVTVGPGDSTGGKWGEAARLHEIEGTYSCNVLFGGTTDLAGLWKNTLRTYVINQARSIFNASQIAVVEDNPSYDKSANTISCRIRLFAVINGASVYEYRVTQSVDYNSGALIVPVYNGDRFAAHVYEGPAVTIRETTIRAVLVGLQGIASDVVVGGRWADGATSASPTQDNKPPGKSGWIRLVHRPTYTPLRSGIPGLPNGVERTEFTQTIRERFVKAVDGGSSSQAPSGPATGPGGAVNPGRTPITGTGSPARVSDSGSYGSGGSPNGGIIEGGLEANIPIRIT